MTIQVNNLDTRVRFERKVTTQDSTYGTEIVSWSPVCVVWAEVLDVLPSRQQAEQVRQVVQVATLRSKVRIRYRTDIDATMRMLIGQDVYQIVGGPAEIGRHEFCEILAEKTST
jgi:SPP1 family predicted phage head-tail adaptor